MLYAYRVTESNDQDSTALGVLCLVFRFENEMEGIFRNLIEENDWMEITLLDRDGVVISSSDPYHIPIGARLQKVLDKDYQLVRFGGREYFAKTCETQGYEGFVGLGWYGHVMVPLDSAFRKGEQDNAPRVDEKTMHKVVTASTLFSEDLVDIPRQADGIQRELDVTVWNGNVQIANTKSGDNSFSKSLLNEISKTGVRTKQVFEDSISNLNQTVISSYLGEAAQAVETNARGGAYIDFKYPRSQGTEEVVELSTFVVNNRLFAMQSNSIICSLNNQEITPMVGSDPRCLGIIFFMRSSIPVVSLRSELGGRDGYDKDNDCIIVMKLKRSNADEEEIVGLVIDRVMDSPEIPQRCLERCEGMLYASNSMVRPEQGDERGLMLLVLDMASIAQRILDEDDYSVPSERPLLVSNR